MICSRSTFTNSTRSDFNGTSNSLEIRFYLEGTDKNNHQCDLHLQGVDPYTSFWAKPCGNGYTVSWGYKPDTDGAVMTICE